VADNAVIIAFSRKGVLHGPMPFQPEAYAELDEAELIQRWLGALQENAMLVGYKCKAGTTLEQLGAQIEAGQPVVDLPCVLEVFDLTEGP